MRTLLTTLLLSSAIGTACASAAAAPNDALGGWLSSTYGPSARASGEWKATVKGDDGAELAVTRSVCLSRDHGGLRYVAVCSSLVDAGHPDGGRVDLWVLRQGSGGWQVSAQARDVEAGSTGTPGDVKLLPLTATTAAFTLASPFSNMGWNTENQLVFVASPAQPSTLTQALNVSTYNDNSMMAACGKGESNPGCRSKPTSMRCTLSAATGGANGALPALVLHAKGKLDGRAIDHRFTLAYANGKWTPPSEADQISKGCQNG